MIYYPEIKYIRLAEKEKNADERQNQQIIRMAESKPRRQDNDSFAGSSYYYDVRPGLGRISPVRAAGLEVVLLRCQCISGVLGRAFHPVLSLLHCDHDIPEKDVEAMILLPRYDDCMERDPDVACTTWTTDGFWFWHAVT